MSKQFFTAILITGFFLLTASIHATTNGDYGVVPSLAAEARDVKHGKDCATCHSLTDQEATTLLKPLDLAVKTVRHSPVPGLFEVVADKSGKEGIIYVDYRKKLLMQGVIIDAGELQATAPAAVKRQPAEKSSKP